MSDRIDAAITALNAKLNGAALDGTAKFVVRGDGVILVDSDGARTGDAASDVTLTADGDVFEAIVMGDLDPASAFMTGKLDIDGDMGLALQLAGALS
ncbi:SCP2 sterol-binding domain-containing protein [Roseovarius dicentrarchi]|uniref:SCP2 sterol-binding domain-containing protein n=1 Tax=Roseovarius dicentrarchi TaxID=2250573 RepID=UPI000DEB9B64|nr:SCP2 sterol-binding domain-containing protein [Roseovarius dicentrarchi]